MATVGIVSVAASALALDNVEIIDVAGRQRYPWNGLVDIDFELRMVRERRLLQKIKYDFISRKIDEFRGAGNGEPQKDGTHRYEITIGRK